MNQILLILDVDETLIYATKKELDYSTNLKVGDYYIYVRPGLIQFLLNMNKIFKIGVWSSASDNYVNEVVKLIIPELIRLEFVWARSKCSYRRDPNFSNFDSREFDQNHYNFIKPLRKLKKKGFQLDRMLIVDDSPHKCQENYGNAIYPSEFVGNRSDKELYYLGLYLKSIRNSTKIREMEKRNWRSSVIERLT